MLVLLNSIQTIVPMDIATTRNKIKLHTGPKSKLRRQQGYLHSPNALHAIQAPKHWNENWSKSRPLINRDLVTKNQPYLQSALLTSRSIRLQFCKTQFCKAPFCKTQYIKTQFCKTQFCKTQFCKTQFCKTQFCKTHFCKTFVTSTLNMPLRG